MNKVTTARYLDNQVDKVQVSGEDLDQIEEQEIQKTSYKYNCIAFEVSHFIFST